MRLRISNKRPTLFMAGKKMCDYDKKKKKIFAKRQWFASTRSIRAAFQTFIRPDDGGEENRKTISNTKLRTALHWIEVLVHCSPPIHVSCNAHRRRKTFLALIGAGIYVANDYFCHLQRDTVCRLVYIGARRAVANGELCAFHWFKISILPFRWRKKRTKTKTGKTVGRFIFKA